MDCPRVSKNAELVEFSSGRDPRSRTVVVHLKVYLGSILW
jgi:hypothetical protein